MKSLGKVLKYVFPKYWKNAALNFFFTLLSIVFGLFSFTSVIPFLNVLFGQQPIVDNMLPFEFNKDVLMHNFNYYIGQIIIEEGQAGALMFVSILVLVCIFFKTTFLYLARFVVPPLYSGVIYDIRNDLYSKTLKLPMAYYSDERKGDIMSRMTNDMVEIEASVVRSLDVLFKEPVTLLIYLITLIIISPQLTLFVFILLPITGLIIGRIGKSLRKNSTVAQNKLGDILALIEETLGGLKIIKAFNAENKMDKRFRTENSFYRWITIKILRKRDLASPLSEFLGSLVVVIVLYYGGSMVLNGENNLSAGALIGYIVIFSQVLTPAKAFSVAYYNIQKGLASIDRIEKIFSADIKIKSEPNAKVISEFNQSINYKAVSFKYIDDWVLKDVDLTVKKGSTMALVGQSGSGKSTMVDLLPRFYDVDKGSIEIDGVNLRDYKLPELRRLMGIVNQESILFNDTIYNNIAFGVEGATKEQIIEAAKVANAHEFIMEAPEQYETNIGDRGGKLSGGQRQRISIARAILANPPIMILDEATSALDTESEKLVQDSLNYLMQNRTSIVIAHRLSTVIHADLICVMNHGKIVEQGTHQELLLQNGYYKKLHDTQMFA